MRRCRGRSQNCLQIGAHYLFYPVQSSELQEMIQVRLSRSLAIGSECLDGYIEADLASVFEAIGDGLLRGVDPDCDTVDRDGLDAGAKGWFRVPECTERDAAEFRNLRVARNRHIHTVWNLIRETVVRESRDQADDASRDPQSYGNQIGVR